MIENIIDRQQQIYELMYKDTEKMNDYIMQIVLDRCVKFIMTNKVPKEMYSTIMEEYVKIIDGDFVKEIYGDIYKMLNKLSYGLVTKQLIDDSKE